VTRIRKGSLQVTSKDATETASKSATPEASRVVFPLLVTSSPSTSAGFSLDASGSFSRIVVSASAGRGVQSMPVSDIEVSPACGSVFVIGGRASRSETRQNPYLPARSHVTKSDGLTSLAARSMSFAALQLHVSSAMRAAMGAVR
jgi:hypothetical protein